MHVLVAPQGPRLQEQRNEERGVRGAVAADQKVHNKIINNNVFGQLIAIIAIVIGGKRITFCYY